MDKVRFTRRFENKIPARWHMTLICMTTIACGIVFSKVLLFYNLSQPMIRYGLAVLLSYGVFFLLIYFWLRWHFGLGTNSQTSNSLDALDLIDVPTNIELPDSRWAGGGGKFSGGGASFAWEDDQRELASSDSSVSFGEEASSIGDIDELAVIVLIIGLIVAISGSAFYVIYQAPEILFEAAFEVVLVAGLFRRGKRIQAEGWTYSIFKRTWIPLSLVLPMALAFGFTIKYQCPAATSFSDYRSLCWGQIKN